GVHEVPLGSNQVIEGGASNELLQVNARSLMLEGRISGDNATYRADFVKGSGETSLPTAVGPFASLPPAGTSARFMPGASPGTLTFSHNGPDALAIHLETYTPQ